MADEFLFPMRLRTAMERTATVLTNCANYRHRVLDEDSQGLMRRALDDLEDACAEANLAVRPASTPVAEVYGTTKSFGEGDDERFYEGAAVRLLREVPLGTKLYDRPAPARAEPAQDPRPSSCTSIGYAYNLTGLQVDAREHYGMTPDETLAAAQALYKRNLITDPVTDERRLAQFMFEEAASLINSYKAVSGRSEFDPEYEAPCWTRDIEGIHMGIMPRAMPAAALFGFSMSDAETRVYSLVHARFLSLFIRPGA